MSNTVLLSTVLYSNFLFTTVSSSTVLSITVLSSTVLSITILSSYVWSITGLSNTVLFSTVLSSTVLSSTVLSSTVLFSTVLSSYVLFITVLSSAVLFCGQVGGATQGCPVGDDRALRQRPQLQGGPQEEGGQVLPPGHGYREAWVQCVELSTGGGLQGGDKRQELWSPGHPGKDVQHQGLQESPADNWQNCSAWLLQNLGEPEVTRICRRTLYPAIVISVLHVFL